MEFTIAVPVLLFIVLAALQAGLAFHAKSNLNYAAFQAARTGAVEHASPAAMFNELARSLVPYFGGGADAVQLSQRLQAVRADFAQGSARIEILSPTSKSFDDYQSPELAARFPGSTRVIPNVNLINMKCPRDRPGCPSDPTSNASGQSLQDANLLALRVTYGIPAVKQVPLAGSFYVTALRLLGVGEEDGFIASLIEQGRIPIVARAVVRMSSEAFEHAAVQFSGSIPAAGGGGGVPAGGSSQGGAPGDPNGAPDPGAGPGGPGPPRGCRAGDPRCDPNCGTRLCCVVPQFPK